MFAKHFTVFLNFNSYWSFTAQIQTNTKIGKVFLVSQIVIGLIGVLLAISAAYGRLIFFESLAAQGSTARHISHYNIMTILLLPAVTETRITVPSGEDLDIGSWFYKSGALTIRPATLQGLLYFAAIIFLTILPSLGLILNVALEEFKLSDIVAIIFIALGVMMYIHALKRC